MEKSVLNRTQIDWLAKQTATLRSYYATVGAGNMKDQDFEWLVNTADAIINMVVEKSTNMAESAAVRRYVLNVLAEIETDWEKHQ